ncbi:MAG: RusA family crossover junction endodeoxyribonuclease [FCB group bacterium]|nr:RusA family crossover junction endodeoxyribonuclease [FCB group bacterium]
MITLEIPGKPIAKKRPRFWAKSVKGKAVSGVYKDADESTAEGKFSLLAWEQLRVQELDLPLTGALIVRCLFFLQRPKSHFGTGKNSDKLKPSAPEYHIIRPDIDNLLKFVCDALNGVAWKDDSQIVLKSGQKMYGDPSTSVIIDEFLPGGVLKYARRKKWLRNYQNYSRS